MTKATDIGCEEYEEIVSADVDGVLEPHEKISIETHLRGCSRCQAVRHEQLLARSAIRDRVSQQITPAALRRQIAAALNDPASARPGVFRIHPKRHTRRLLLAGAVAAGFLLMMVPFLRSGPQDLLAVLVSDAQAAETDQLTMELLSADLSAVRGYYRESGQIPFENSAEDLGPLGFRIKGANVARIGNVTTTLTVYENDSARVVCRRFPAGSLPLPTGGERIGDSEIFTVEGVTVAITHLGDVTCCLATTMPRSEFSQRLAKSDHPH